MKKAIYYLLTLWGVLSLQAVNNHLMGGSPFSIDILLICTLFFGLTRGPITGQAMGVMWGLLSDVSSLGLVGLNMLLYALAGYGAGMLSRQLDETKLWTQGIFTFAMSIGYSALFIALDRIFSTGDRPVAWTMAFHPLVNAFLAPAFFWFMHRWSEAWEIFPTVQ